MFNPVRVPFEAVGYAKRLLEEVVTIRVIVSDAVTHFSREVDDLKAEFAHVRERVDELAETIPTVDDKDKGVVERAKDALTSDG